VPFIFVSRCDEAVGAQQGGECIVYGTSLGSNPEPGHVAGPADVRHTPGVLPVQAGQRSLHATTR